MWRAIGSWCARVGAAGLGRFPSQPAAAGCLPVSGPRGPRRPQVPAAGPGVPLGARHIAMAPPAGANRGGPPAKAPLEIPFMTKTGLPARVRRLQPQDMPALREFLTRTGLGFVVSVGGGSPASVQRLVATEAAEHVWMAASARHDAFVAQIAGRIVGLSSLVPHPAGDERPLDPGFLEREGLRPQDVCVSRMLVERDYRAQGIGKVLKQAQVRAAADAGFHAVVSETAHAAVKAMVEQLGGTVQAGAVFAWTVLKTGRDSKEE